MAYDNPIENARRIKAGMLSLVAGQTIEHAHKNSDLIVVFDGPFTRFSGGRIILFQEYILNNLGFCPELIGQKPACIKAFFHIGRNTEISDMEIKSTLRSFEAADFFKKLAITYVQFRSDILFFEKRPTQYVPSPPAP